MRKDKTSTFPLKVIFMVIGILIALLILDRVASAHAEALNTLIGNSPQTQAQNYLKTHNLLGYTVRHTLWWSDCCESRGVPREQADRATMLLESAAGHRLWIDVQDQRGFGSMNDGFSVTRNWHTIEVYTRASDVIIPGPDDCKSACYRELELPS